MEIKKESNDYTIKLNNYEVLVFFEWLVKFVENNEIIDKAEQKILFDLECLLESTLEEPFMENYKDLIHIAKKSIINKFALQPGCQFRLRGAFRVGDVGTLLQIAGILGGIAIDQPRMGRAHEPGG